MTSATLSDTLLALSLLGFLLLVGTFLRAKIRLFQTLFLPASVIGGFVGLLVSPSVLGHFAPVVYPERWLTLYALLPGVLIIPVVASVPLGLSLSGGRSRGQTARNVVNMGLLTLAIGGLQLVVGGAVGMLFAWLMPDLGIYSTFGMEMNMGFSGGHGTAGLVGNFLNDLGLEQWEVAQGVTVTYATIGLLAGIIAGIGMIHRLRARHAFDHAVDLSRLTGSWMTGIQPDREAQQCAGRETTVSTSIDVLTFTVALILSGSALAVWLRSLVQGLPVVGMIPVWAYAVIVMWVIWAVMSRLRLDFLVDPGIKSKVASMLTDFAIVAALVSMPVEAVLTYAWPIAISALIGFVGTLFVIFASARGLFSSAAFERALLIFGLSTGVFLTGLLLLKIVDPDFKTPAMRDGSLAYSIVSVVGFMLLPVYVGLATSMGPLAIVLVGGGTGLIAAVAAMLIARGNRA